MRLIRRIFESTNIKRHSKIEQFIKSIWFISEYEIFEAFSELHDGIDVSIEINFFLKGSKFKYDLHKDSTVDTEPGKLNLERIEAYAASGLTPCFEVVITKNDTKDDIKMHSYAMESLHHIEDYSLFDVKRGTGYLKLHLKLDESSEQVKSMYHKKSARSFNSIFSEFRENGYKVLVGRSFVHDNKLNLMYKEGSKKIYYITLEKSYKIELEMIDELAHFKSKFIETINKLNQLPDIYNVDELFDIGTSSDNSTKGKIGILFILYVYEK